MQLAGWRGLAGQVDALARQTGARFIAADDYGPAAKLARELPGPLPVIGVEPRWAFFTLKRPELTGQTGLLIRSERRGPDIAMAPWAALKPVGEAERMSGNAVVEKFRIFEVLARPSAAPMAVLPRP